jgi:hypothetical protein
MNGLALAAIAALLMSCGPKALEPNQPTASPKASSGIFDGSPAERAPQDKALNGEVRKVLVHEVLDGGRYLFLDAQEMTGARYWIATAPGDFVAGGTYQFSRGLYKTGYRSDVLDRTFDDLYLVSDIGPIGGAPAAAPAGNPHGTSPKPARHVLAEGALPIAEVVDRAQELAGTMVRVTGVVTKVNPDIMNRNWIHLQDGSRNAFDFVVTTAQPLPVGHTVTLEGVLSVDRDFGAGYKYDVILENGQTIR